ncbi:hypothetical protein KA013_04490 [Patescibacteria group bacterium]|nr:hypothetical protein [Patescibacteria group bacterium]
MSASQQEQIAEVAVEETAHEDPSTQTILLNVAAQLINIAIFMFIFVKFFGGKIRKQLDDRQKDITAIAHAKEEYADIMAKAQSQVDQLLVEGKAHKEKLLQEATLLSKKKEEEIIAQANSKAESLVAQAEGSAKRMNDELENNFIDSVKRISKLVVQKVAGDNAAVQDAYLDQLSKEFSSQK